VFASSPRPGRSPDRPAGGPRQSTTGLRPRPAGERPPGPAVPFAEGPSGADQVAAESPAPRQNMRRRRLWLVPALVAVVAAGGGAAFVATRGIPFGGSHRTATVDSGESGAADPRPVTTGVAGVPVPPTESPATAPSAIAPTGAATTSASASASTSGKPAVAGKPNKSKVNLALHKRVESSTDEAPGYPASAAVDGNVATRWSSGFADPQWIKVDLGAVWQVTDVRLTWEHAYAIKYRVDLSLDGKHWATTYRTSSGTDGLRDIPIDSTPARYVRVYGTQRSSQYGYSLLELEVR
jgi:hypothetical protein